MRDIHVGVDIGGTKIAAVAAGTAQPAVGASARLTWRNHTIRSYAELLDTAAQTVLTTLKDRGHTSADVIGIGIAVAAWLDPTRRGLAYAANLGVRAPAPFADDLERAVGIPVDLVNDGDATLLAERGCGAAAGIDEVALFTLGTGVGGAVVANGHLVTGCGRGGEIGHLPISGPGTRCSCGAVNCLETVASGPASVRRYLGAVPAANELVDGRELVALADRGDPAARDCIRMSGRAVGEAVERLAVVLDPAMIVVGGSFGTGGFRYLAKGLHRHLADSTLFPFDPRIPAIKPAALGATAAAIGALLHTRSMRRDHR